ncbi:MAG: hypothetical protein Q4B60_01730 [Erysipelotrichaceae bacterium]|nr:hypothetical protein [Erysipelotrichaceae bacterium]
MKKIITLLCMMMLLVACSGNKAASNSNTSSNNTSVNNSNPVETEPEPVNDDPYQFPFEKIGDTCPICDAELGYGTDSLEYNGEWLRYVSAFCMDCNWDNMHFWLDINDQTRTYFHLKYQDADGNMQEWGNMADPFWNVEQ